MRQTRIMVTRISCQRSFRYCGSIGIPYNSCEWGGRGTSNKICTWIYRHWCSEPKSLIAHFHPMTLNAKCTNSTAVTMCGRLFPITKEVTWSYQNTYWDQMMMNLVAFLFDQSGQWLFWFVHSIILFVIFGRIFSHKWKFVFASNVTYLKIISNMYPNK